MSSPLLPPPDRLTPAQRAQEITLMLAAAIRRSQAPNTAENDAVRLGFAGHQRLHTTPYPTETLS